MNHWLTFFGSCACCLAFVISTAAETHNRQPWDFSDDERIAARISDEAAAERLRNSADITSQRTREAKAVPFDVINGRRDAHLFLRFEIFDHMERMAFAEDATTREAYRQSLEADRIRLGLPSDIWVKLAVASAAYLADSRRQRDITLRLSGTDSATVRVVNKMLCQDRFSALTESDRQFGPAFSQFLYSAVAKDITRVVLKKPDPAQLREIARGCQ